MWAISNPKKCLCTKIFELEPSTQEFFNYFYIEEWQTKNDYIINIDE